LKPRKIQPGFSGLPLPKGIKQTGSIGDGIMAVIKDVAKIAGVSIGTVSRYLNHPKTVKADTVARITEAIERLNYKPSVLARSMRTKRSKQIALIVPDIANWFYSEFYNAMHLAALAGGYSIVLVTTEEDREALREYLENISTQNVDGIILCFLDEDDLGESLAAAQEKLPIVLLSWDILNTRFNTVVIDLCESLYKTTRHLIDMGRKRIAYIGGTIGSRISAEKYRGYRKAMTESGLPIRQEYYFEGGYRIGTGFRGIRNFMLSVVPPDAVVCANDVLAIGCIKYLTKKKYAVPDDVAVTGMDNIALSSIFEPSLTTCNIPMTEMSETAISLLHDAIHKRNAPKRQILFNTKLLVRNSTDKDVLIDFEF
jgi:DNA-binding LacI/PurR family transcriptional regulator